MGRRGHTAAGCSGRDRRHLADRVSAVRPARLGVGRGLRAVVLLAKKADLAATVSVAERAHRARPLLHPEIGKLYRDWVIDARNGLRDPDHRTEATTALRAMVEEIVLTPEAGKLAIVLKGD